MVIASLLLQVQAVFTCQMMGYHGSVEHCCCDEMKQQKQAGNEMDGASVCCDFDTELSVKAVDPDKDSPFLLSHISLEAPAWIAVLFLIFILWPVLIRSLLLKSWGFDDDPGQTGTQTWLSTSRLRL